MRIFTTTMDGVAGPIINGIDEGVWVERYRPGGEFTFVFDNPELLDQLPLGSLITHDETLEIMMVENWEIDEERGSTPKITVSGRSLDHVLMENRRVTVKPIGGDPGGEYIYWNIAIPGKGYKLQEIKCGANPARAIMEAYLIDGVESDFEIVSGLSISQLYTDEVGEDDWQDYNFNSLPTVYDAVQELLKTDDVGIRVERCLPGELTTKFVIYKGREIDPDVGGKVLSWLAGDIEKAKYFWSTRTDLNAVFIHDANKVVKYFKLDIDPDGLSTRIGEVDVSNLELDWGPEPWEEAIFEANHLLMRAKGRAYLRENRSKNILEPVISEHAKMVYGEDYLLGDIITIFGNYETITTMRITENTRTFGKDGETDYPTLSEPIE